MVKLAYILAASHSGSTLLTMLLGAHPEAFTVGELKATNLGVHHKYRCSCGQFIKSCAFWAKVSARMQSKGLRFDITSSGTNFLACKSPYARRLLRPLHRGPLLEALRDLALSFSPLWRMHVQHTQQQNAALIGVLQELSGAKIIIDSSKIDLRLKYLLRNPALDIRVIWLIRDGRGVALTYMHPGDFADARKRNLRGGGSGFNGLPHEPSALSMTAAAREWRRSNEAAACLLSRLDRSQWVQVRYEELCMYPEKTLQRLCAFLELEPGKIVRDFRAVEQHVLGNGMRLDTTSEISLDERWRDYLAQEELRVFDVVAGKLNRQYGYV
jgi:hypothetical protein